MRVKKRAYQWLCFFLCVAIFLVLRLHTLSNKHPPLTRKIEKPALPAPILVTQDHPWLKIQPAVTGAALEIVRDMEKIRHLSTAIPELSEKEIASILMERLLSLQATIPFTFPDSLYNVLCITESEGGEPAPFHVYKRLYLGETELGLPFYLDVRVFELGAITPEEIIAWHLNILEGSCEELPATEGETTFLCRGKRAPNRADTTHGFASLQGERALFLKFCEKENRLYVCYAEAPLTTLNRYLSFFMIL
jgi:hypothetical protein